jgi:hypothetical protein
VAADTISRCFLESVDWLLAPRQRRLILLSVGISRTFCGKYRRRLNPWPDSRFFWRDFDDK